MCGFHGYGTAPSEYVQLALREAVGQEEGGGHIWLKPFGLVKRERYNHHCIGSVETDTIACVCLQPTCLVLGFTSDDFGKLIGKGAVTGRELAEARSTYDIQDVIEKKKGKCTRQIGRTEK